MLVKRAGSQADLPPTESQKVREAQVAEFRKEGKHYSELFETMNANLSSRVRMLRFAVEVFRRPPETWEAALKALRQDHAVMVRAILEQMASPAVRKRVIIAVERFEDASQAMQEVRDRLQALEGLNTDQAFHQISSLSIPKLKGKLYLLTTYDLLFKSDPLLNQMFPSIPRDAKDTRLPAKKTPPKPGTNELPKQAMERPVQTMPTPPPGEGLLKTVLKRFKPST